MTPPNTNKSQQSMNSIFSDEDRKKQLNQALFGNVAAGGETPNVLSGGRKEQNAQLGALNFSNLVYGQGIGQTGQDVQALKGRMQDRANQSGADPTSAAIMGQKAAAIANAQRVQAQTGMKGGAAMASLEGVSRERDEQIAKSLYGQARQSDLDLRGFLGNIISGTAGLVYGERANAVAAEKPKDAGGLFGTGLFA